MTTLDRSAARASRRGICLLVAQDRTWVEHWQRQDDGSWRVVEATDPKASIDLPEIGSNLPVADVYAGVSGV